MDQRGIEIVDAVSQSQQFRVAHGRLALCTVELIRESIRPAKRGGQPSRPRGKFIRIVNIGTAGLGLVEKASL
jgi:hypothetical protein